MYAHHFGLTQDPFSIAPDPRYLFMSERHREALAHLLYGVAAPGSAMGGAGGGFVLLTGDIGTGKTTVCRCFLEQIPAGCHVAYIFNPKLTVTELLQSVCEEFHIPVPQADAGAATVKNYIDALNAFLLQSHAAGQSSVLIIDEAQNLSADVLEQLRLLTNLETSERKLLQIVLIGQPELRAMLARPELEQLAQRVIARFHLDALSEPETLQYIEHRLAIAGHSGPPPFDAKALKHIHRLARGVPRRINLLAGRALLGAWATGQHQATRAVVDKAAAEVFGPQTAGGAGGAPARSPWLVGSLGLLAGAGLVGLLVWQVGGPRPGAAPAVGAAPAASGVASAARVASAASAARVASAASAAASAASAPKDAAPIAGASAPASAPVAAVSASAPASTPTVAASAVAAASAASAPAGFDWMSALPRDQGTAWRQLAPAWQLPAGADPCPAPAASPVQCYRGANLSLPLIRQLGRPGILTLQQGNEPAVYVVLTGLNDQMATLQVDGRALKVPLVTLGTVWRGDFATFWRPPPGYSGELAERSGGPAVDWLALRLSKIDGAPLPAASGATFDPALKARLQAFQRAQGLRADGRAGPLTLMQLSHATGGDEPRLATDTR
jgi:general secretion pathway protein A